MSAIRPIAILCLGLSAVTLAQTPPTPPGTNGQQPQIPGLPPQPGAAPEPGNADAPRLPVVERPANFNPNIPIGENKIEEDIIKPKLNGNELAGLYRAYTGRRVIVSAAAAQAEFSFVQDATPEDPLTYATASELIRKAAAIENFIFVPDGTDPNLDYLTLATGGIRPTGIGIDVYTENDPLPEGGVVISYVMSFDHIKPENAVNAFQQIVGQFGAFGSIAPIPNTASVVITENTTLIRKLIDLKREIDKPSAQVATRFIHVRYADVTELAATLNELINAQQEAQTTAGIQRSGAGAPPPATPAVPGMDTGAAVGGGEGSQAGEATPVQIVADPRTSRIFAMGRPVDLLFVEGLIREFDVQTDSRTYSRRKLRFLTVSEFLPIAGDALTRAFTGTGESGATAGGTSGGTTTRGASNRAGGGASSGFNSQQSNFGNNSSGRFGGSSSFGGSSGFGGGSSGSRGDMLGDPTVSSAPESLLVGRTLLVADNITNSVIIQGPPSGIEIVERLLDELDVKAPQVMISTVFGQLALNDSISTGVDWLNVFKATGSNSGLAGSIINGGTSITDPAGITDLLLNDTTNSNGFPNKSGLSIYGRIGEDLGVFVNLLQSNSDFTVLSRPSIFTSNNQRGTISSGRRIAVPTNSNSFSAGGVSTNIEYRDVVLKLEVIPLINDENTVTLQIALVSDDVIGESDEIEGIGRVPIIGTREILTTVTVPNNQTVVLGGLITSNDEEGVTGVPILSSIPGLGRLFSTKTEGISRDELLVFIQPSIIDSERSMDSIQADMDARFRVSDKAREFSDGPGVLPDADAIVPANLEKGASRPQPAANKPANSSATGTRSTLRPIHRR